MRLVDEEREQLANETKLEVKNRKGTFFELFADPLTWCSGRWQLDSGYDPQSNSPLLTACTSSSGLCPTASGTACLQLRQKNRYMNGYCHSFT
mmetsp:Transcript_9007/g.21945  ORF Transcript_9007/g.21945 Transcript_9007/m.21945 type:complete len:93 (-) Transcript_9007:230-508(-)